MADENGLTAEKIQELAKQAASAPAVTPPSPLKPQPPAQADAPAADSKIEGNNFDQQVQKMQGYMRMLGLTDVEVGGQKKRLVVDGLMGPNTQTALAKYNADNGLAAGASVEDSIRHMEERLKQNGPEIQERLNSIMEQGTDALRSDVRGMQLTLNLIKNESLKVDGINGILTTTAYNQYSNKNYSVPTPRIEVATPAPAAPQSTNAGTYTIPAETVPPTVNVENVAATRQPVPGQPQQRHEQRYEQRPSQQPQQRYETTRQNPVYSAREPYNNASGAEQLQRTMALREEYRMRGYADPVAKQLATNQRVGELMRSGADENSAMRQVRQESQMADQQERAMRTNQNRNVSNGDREYRQTEAQRRQATAENTRDGKTVATVFADMAGLRGQPRQMATALGGLVGQLGGSLLGDSRPSSTEERGYGRTANEVGRAVGGNSVGRAADVVIRHGGGLFGSLFGGSGQDARSAGDMRVITYPQQPTSGVYGTRSQGSWDNRQISPDYNTATSYGMSEAQRQQMLYDQAMQQNRQQQPEYNRNSNNIYGPGG